MKTLFEEPEPERDLVLNMLQVSEDSFLVHNQWGEVSLLDRATLKSLLDQFLRRNQ